MNLNATSARLLIAPSTGILILMSWLFIAVAALMLIEPTHDIPMAKCPDSVLVQDKADCAHWAAEFITDTRLTMLPGGSCRVCNTL
jgi:hypothetical protein